VSTHVAEPSGQDHLQNKLAAYRAELDRVRGELLKQQHLAHRLEGAVLILEELAFEPPEHQPEDQP